MKFRTVYLLFATFLIGHISYGQSINLDSCGLDTNSVLNKYEIIFLDSVLFAPREFKKGFEFDFKKGFELKDKKLAFFSCTHDINDEGFLTKDKFFNMIKPLYRGPRGLLVLNIDEKLESGGYDAIIMINCKAYNDTDLIDKLKNYNK